MLFWCCFVGGMRETMASFCADGVAEIGRIFSLLAADSSVLVWGLFAVVGASLSELAWLAMMCKSRNRVGCWDADFLAIVSGQEVVKEKRNLLKENGADCSEFEGRKGG
ncbi:hypothetical protein SLEP1_g56816 [Rubroshorea leprosula]|uniref:Transmembrane protein n=1 Tax=Rubroshorea leprosula TaxID=152421 RepID=A0AAV5MKL9_9ROSI|nr:hypothetical protein SLEP1_g56816 [Rubroshorea leprosula]